MCLFVDKKETEKLLKSGKKFVWGYKKVILKSNWDIFNQRITNYYLDSPYYSHEWKPGVNKSNSRSKKTCCRDRLVINHGIHVYLNSKICKPKEYIKVKCYIKDLIGISYHMRYIGNDYTRVIEAAFTKVELSVKEYNRRINLSLIKG
jgi:hypothetical protein